MADDKETDGEEPPRAIGTGDEQFWRDVDLALNLLSPEEIEELIQGVFEGRAAEAYLVIEKATKEEDLTPEEQALLDEIRVVLGVKGSNPEDWIAREGGRRAETDTNQIKR